jgi:RHS repeat-associated protein
MISSRIQTLLHGLARGLAACATRTRAHGLVRRTSRTLLVCGVSTVALPSAMALCTPSFGLPGAVASPSSLGAVLSGLGVLGPARAADSAVLSAAAGSPPTAAASCQAGPGSSAHSEPAVLPPSAPDRTAGNPVDPFTGAKHAHRVDVELPSVEVITAMDSQARYGPVLASPHAGSGLTLQFSRFYHSGQDYALSLGPGWAHSFETRLARRRLASAPAAGLPAVQLQLLQADGRRIEMQPVERLNTGDGGSRVRYRSAELVDGVVDEYLASDGLRWEWRWPSGRRLHFDRHGRLSEIVAPDLDRISLDYDGQGRLIQIADPHGRSIQLSYGEGRLVGLRLPDGQMIRYVYDSKRRLAAVRYPDGRLVQHHYEDPSGAHRLTGTTEPDGRRSHHRYDAQARVIETHAHDAEPGDALSLRYYWQRDAHVAELEFRGAVTRYRWRVEAGGLPRLESITGPGCPQCPPPGPGAARDAQGRVMRFGEWRIGYDRIGRVASLEKITAPKPARWRFDYASADPLAQPSRIVAPSVVAGEARTLLFRYNARGQLVELTERGLAPYQHAVQTIARRWRLEYAEHARHAGKLVAIERIELADNDSAAGGPAAAVGLSPGTPEAAGRVLARTELSYDPLRRLARVSYPLGLSHGVVRDALGRPVEEVLADGVRISRSFDTAWRLARLAIGDQALRFGYEGSGALREIDTGAGRGIKRSDREPPSGRVLDPGAAPATILPKSSHSLPIGLAVSGPALMQVDAEGRLTETRFDDFGRAIEERSAQRGLRQVIFDALDRPVRWVLPGGEYEERRYDAAGRLIERREGGPAGHRLTVLHWDGLQLAGIDHPEQDSRAVRDAQGRLTRLAHRVANRWINWDFSYDPAGRLIERGLGDGHRLRLAYDAEGQPVRLELLSPSRARPIALVQRAPTQDERVSVERLGASMVMERRIDAQGELAELVWRARAAGPVLARFALHRDDTGRIHTVTHHEGEDRFAFDLLGRLIIRERHGAAGAVLRDYRSYSPGGDLVLSRDEAGVTRRWSSPAADSLGRPLTHEGWALRYGPSGRIEAMEPLERREAPHRPVAGVGARPGEPVTQHLRQASAIAYGYNALGERVWSRVEHAREPARTARFLYHRQSLAAELDGEGQIRRHFIDWAGRKLAIVEVERDRLGRPVTRVYWLLSDHLGTPHAAVDEEGRIVWRGQYGPFGELLAEEGRLDQPLRLPGQFHDRETGLFDNYRRSYDPRRGRYLEPDPLGLAGGWNLYAYVGGNPVQATDPLGLILFAFDGTGNSNPARAPDTLSNVAKFASLYAPSDRYYMSGVGTLDSSSGIAGGALDFIDAASARRRVDHMLSVLDSSLHTAETSGDPLAINVIGFSRGAAMARDFANTVAARIRGGHYLSLRRCVSLNFVGLWDTVAQFGLNGQANAQWNLGIPPEARVVVHAVAVNERRRFYPLESIGAQGRTASGGLRIERGFIGDHGDVGGSHAEGDLSDVALGWMVEQARAAGVPLKALNPEWRTVSEPLLHDARSALQPGPDRDVRGLAPVSALLETQRTGLTREQAETMIRRYPYRLRGVDGSATLAGRVDMAAYSAWLAEHYGHEVLY